MAKLGDSGDDTNPLTERGFLIAAGVLAVILVFGAVVILTGGNNNEGGGSKPPPEQAAQKQNKTEGNEKEGAAREEEGCGPTGGSQKVPRATPPNTRWELVGKIAVPTAPETIGPAKKINGLRRCYSRTPLGALYAATNAFAAVSHEPIADVAARELTAPGPGRDAVLAKGDDSSEDDGTRVQIAAFSFGTYSRSMAVMKIVGSVVIPGRPRAYVSYAVSMRWSGGDWKLAVPDTGSPFEPARQVPDLRGFVAWSGA